MAIINQISRISLAGGIIGAFTTNPRAALEKELNRANEERWTAVQITSHSTTNIFIAILQYIVLFLTLFLYTWGGGYLILYQKEI